MSTLLMNKLSALPVGTELQLSYGFMEGRNLMVAGKITDKDSCCMEILDEQGNLHYVDYSTVKVFTVSGRNTPTPVPVCKPEKKLLHGQTLEQFSQRIGDYEMKNNLFSVLSKNEKRLLQTAYDSFGYGVKVNSHEKRLLAAQSARKVIHREMEKGCLWSKEAFELVARMLSREGVHDFAMYAFAGQADQAALAAYKEKQWSQAGTQAAQALAEGNLSGARERDMMIVLEDACIELNDASVAEWLHAKGVDMKELVEDLILYKQKQPAAEFADSLEMLPQLYSGRELISLVEKLQKPEEPVQLTGLVTKILWANSTGEITCLSESMEEQIYIFRNCSVEDAELLAEILREGSGFVQKKCLVSFRLKDGEAVQIRRGPSLAEQVGKKLAQQYEPICWYCRHALGTGFETEAMVLMVEAAVASGNTDLAEQTLDFVEDHRDSYPVYGKAVSLLAQLYHMVHELEESLALTEKALKDLASPDRVRASILIQYCNYAMRLFNETKDETCLRSLSEKADQWLEIYAGNLEDASYQKKHSRVLRWKIRGLLARNLVEEAEAVYGEFTRNFPNDPKVKDTAELISQRRQKLLEQKSQAPLSVPQAEPVQELPVEDSEEEVEDFRVPGMNTGCWEDLNTSEEAYAQRVFSVDGEKPLAAQLAALRAGAMLNPNLKYLADTVSAAVNDPVAEPVYDTAAMVNLLSSCDDRFPVLNRYAVASAYLRTLFRDDNAPLWMRRSILVDEIFGLAQVCECLEKFHRDTGRCAEHYAAYRDSAEEAENREKADMMDQARRLYDAYMVAPARDNGGRKFARFVETKELVHQGLKQYLEWVLTEDRNALSLAREGYRKQFLASDGRRISGEKVDAYIISHWEQAGKNYPCGDGADLQGSRRNALRSSVRSILGVVNDYYRWMERQVRVRTEEGSRCFEQMKPVLCGALNELLKCCHGAETNAEEKTGLHLLGYTARELLDKVTGHWQAGQERYLYADFLNTNLVELGEDFQPDFTGLLTGSLGLVERVFAHAQACKLESGEHIARIFDRVYPDYRNFDTAELIRRYCQMSGQEVDMPHPDRYIMQAKLMAKIEFVELREELLRSGEAEQEKLLLWLYDRCVRTNRFGYLAEGMNYIRICLKERKGAAA